MTKIQKISAIYQNRKKKIGLWFSARNKVYLVTKTKKKAENLTISRSEHFLKLI